MSQLCFNGIAGAILLVLIVLELRASAFRDGLWRDRVRARRNWSFLVSILITLGLVGMITHQFPRVVPSVLHLSAHPILDFVGCLLVAEFLNYVLHYVKHWNSYLWRFHFQHHIETEYSIWLTSHLHGLEVLISASFIATVLCLLGFSLGAKQAYFLFYIFVTTYHHSANDYTLGPLNWLIVCPAYHRLHHTVTLRGNYGSTTTIFDLLFGTAIWPKEEHQGMAYGIASTREPFGFSQEILYMFARKPRPVREAALIAERMGRNLE